MTLPRILVTPGEPAGIGPDVTIKIAQQSWPATLLAVADPDMLAQRAELLKLPLDIQVIDQTQGLPTDEHQAGKLAVIPVQTLVAVEPGKLEVINAEYVLRTLELATRLCLQQQANAIVTGPVNKAVMLDAGISFSGHTEFFAAQSGVAQTVMLFVLEKMKVALATTHIPLSAVPSTITAPLLEAVISILYRGLQQQFKINTPKIAVCGLNPHAGESGHLGTEEVNVITPVLEKLRGENMDLLGPLPADTAFLPEQLKQVDAVLGMYHDQVLPLVKHLAFDHAVNVTLGLPFIRTSVDHGTALELAGTEGSNPGSMRSAIELALSLVR